MDDTLKFPVFFPLRTMRKVELDKSKPCFTKEITDLIKNKHRFQIIFHRKAIKYRDKYRRILTMVEKIRDARDAYYISKLELSFCDGKTI